jgi:hypothetical protein
MSSDISINASGSTETAIMSDSNSKKVTFFGPFVNPSFVTLVYHVLYGVTSGINPTHSIETKV